MVSDSEADGQILTVYDGPDVNSTRLNRRERKDRADIYFSTGHVAFVKLNDDRGTHSSLQVLWGKNMHTLLAHNLSQIREIINVKASSEEYHKSF